MKVRIGYPLWKLLPLWPIYPMAGYSVTLPSVKESPTTSITALNKKIVFSRIGESVRVAGFADNNAPEKNHQKRLN